ncbi:hypothetical protein KO116_01317 [Halomonas sp. KO116]|nr:hypothetical protein KO116_01317 [Halomonas sp. KO116]
MTSILNVPNANQLLAGLPAIERNAFMTACESVELQFGEVLLQPRNLLPTFTSQSTVLFP